MTNHPERTYKIIQKMTRNGVYGKLVTTKILLPDETWEVKEEFFPL